MTWTALPLETDPDAVTARLLAGLIEALNPGHDPAGWAPREGAPEVALAEEIGREAATTNQRAVEAAEMAAAGFGISLYGFPAILAAPATMTVQLTLTSPAATVPAGLTVIGRTDDGVDAAFILPGAVTAAAGVSTVQAQFVATVDGTVSNGVPPGPLTVITSTAAVDAATALTTSADGVDAESRGAYLSRLIDFVAILRPGGVRANDLEVLARSVPGVARALAVDLYDATTGQSGAERTVSVYPIDDDGQPVGPATVAAMQATLEAVREVNFRIRVGTPTYTPVHVTVTAVAEDGADPDEVADAVEQAVLDFLSPATWGSTVADPGKWTATPLVRYLPLTRAAGSVPGLFYLDTVTVNGTTTDLALAGVAALPAPATGLNPSTVSVTVT